ncbi:MAG TPA: sugar-binding domain-containing protein [Pseudonocardiaceae bacterium]
MNGDGIHPRPQLVRERWHDLCGTWQFAFDDDDRGLDEGWASRPDPFDRAITVPYPPESKASGIGDPTFHPVVWYRRTFHVADEDRAGRVLLHFGAVDHRARVWVNGHLVATHEGGHTPFSADITPALHPGDAEQVIVVRAEDRPRDLTQPRGKQYWKPDPEIIWYHRTTGIWQPVWLEPVPTTRLAALRWTPSVTRGSLGLHATLTGPDADRAALRVRVRHGDELLADDTYRVRDTEVEREIVLVRAGEDQYRHLWWPEHPVLLDVELTVLVDGTEVDRVTSYAGLREVGWADGRFLLNGRPYYLRMVLEQGYWPESHLAAPGPEALRREVELIKELGFNGVRIHQKVEDPRFLYWCDRLGLLVWDEMPSAYEFSPTTVERLVREWTEVVRRDVSHPCVVAWVPLNESWGVPGIANDTAQQHCAAMLYHLTRTLDPTRPVISNDGWEHVRSDIWTVHDYTPSGATVRARYGTPEAVRHALREGRPGGRRVHLGDPVYKGQPVVLSEYGGLSYAPHRGERWFGYATVGSAEEFLQRYTELTTAILDCPDIAGFCYTQLTDTEQETNGLLTADRKPKLDPAAVRRVNTRPAAAVGLEEVIASRRPAEEN